MFNNVDMMKAMFISRYWKESPVLVLCTRSKTTTFSFFL